FLVNSLLDDKSGRKNNLIRCAILNHHNYIENFTYLDAEFNEELIEKNLLEINDKFLHLGSENVEEMMDKTLDFQNIHEMKQIQKTYEYIIIKGLLNKCDYAASAHMSCEIKNDFLLNSLENLNYEWRDIQNFCIKNRNDNLVIVGSTGLGKTEASLLWGADNKIFYILPLRTAINAMYERIKNLVKNDYDKKVAVLHGQTDSVYLKELDNDTTVKNENEKFYEYYKNTKKLAMPITVATPDQLFDSVFRYNGYEFKMATFSYSRIIIDEIQAYSPDILAYTIYAIRLINDLGGKIAIFTATLAPFVKDLLTKKSSITSEYKFKDFEYKYECFLSEDKRHNMKIIEEDLNSEYIIGILNQHVDLKTCLIVRNTIKSAQELYNQLQNELDSSKYEVNLLHSKFTVEDRKQKEDEILKDGNPRKLNDKIKIWISTQIVEASLDIDFDIMFTELSELLGLFQRFGRVYRKRTLKSDIPNVYVFTEISEKQISSPYNSYGFIDQTVHNLSKKALIQKGDGIITEQEKLDLINQYFTTENLRDSEYIKQFNQVFNKIQNLTPGKMELKDVKKEFRNIISFKAMPINIYNSSDIAKLIEQINNCYSQMLGLEKEQRNAEKLKLIKLQDKLMDKTLNVNISDINPKNFFTVANEKIYLTEKFYDIEYGLLNDELVDKFDLQPNSGGIFI
ncbi:MAG: CRISPR-associated helicase Cas3', partial [Finegoldia magna]|nr:CRISPR-associated helicase Cas3' [Finegoldia magna]